MQSNTDTIVLLDGQIFHSIDCIDRLHRQMQVTREFTDREFKLCDRED